MKAPLCFLVLAIVLLLSSNVEAQSVEPDTIFLTDGGVMVVQVTDLTGEDVRIISPGGEPKIIPLDGIEKIVDSRGRVIYWRNRVSSKGFSEYLARSKVKRQKILNVGISRDRRGGSGEGWTQFTPRIGWLFSPGFTIELSGGRKKFVEDGLQHCFCDGVTILVGSWHDERTRNIFQVHITKKFSALTDHLSSYSVIGFGLLWDRWQRTETFFEEIEYTETRSDVWKYNIVDGGLGLLFLVAEQFYVRAETRAELWLGTLTLGIVSIGISWRIPL